MNPITPFVFEDNLVRTVQRGGFPWFVGKDVCEVLHIKDHHQALERLDDDERGGYTVPTPSGEQIMIVISEPGVYRLIFTSRRPEAERFKRWLAHEVLPALRKTGKYAMDGAAKPASNPYDITAEAIPVLQTKLQLIREARHLHGHERARRLWSQLDLPPVVANPHEGQGEARDLLQYILDGMFMGHSVRSWLEPALEGEKSSNEYCKKVGLWAEPHKDGFVVANRHPQLDSILKSTDWADGRWQWVLRRFPGACAVPAKRFDGQVSRGVFLPCTVLDFGEDSIDRDFEHTAH